MIDFSKAADFMTTSARLIDRRRFDLLFDDGEPHGPLAALAAYGNPDGGYGWSLEPDLRAASSQPVGALHAFEVLEEISPATSPAGKALCDWLDAASLDDGGLPFAVAGAAGPGTAPWWGGADPDEASLHITSAVCAAAHRVAEADPAVAGHAWLERATEFCLRRIPAVRETGLAIALKYVLEFLDAVRDRDQTAAVELERLSGLLPKSGTLTVAGGAEGEALKPLDFSPWPGRPLRELIDPAAIEADLDRLEAEQHDDGGWDVDFAHYSDGSTFEWRGYATLRALAVLRANDRLPS
jgi:hypothetical protein